MLINNLLIHTKRDEVDSPKATVIITHGIAEHSGRYGVITDHLNEAGYTVVRYDLRGHGLSQGKRGKLKSFHQFIDDLHAIVTQEKKQSKQKVYLIGHSLGGLIVDLYAVKYGNIDGIISSAAPSHYIHDVLPLRFLGYKMLGWVPKKSNFANDQLSRIKEVEELYVSDPLNLKYFHISLAGTMFVSGVRYLNKNISAYQTPVLLIHGGNDKIVPHQMSQRLFELIPANDKKIIIYENNYHEIFNDLDQEKVFKDIIKWLDERQAESI